MALERSDAFRFTMRRSYSSMNLGRRRDYDGESYTLKKSLSTTSLVPVSYDESTDYYRIGAKLFRPWSRKFYRDLYYPDNDYFWYRYYNVGTKSLSYPGVRRLHLFGDYTYPYTQFNYPKHRWSLLDSIYSNWHRYYDSSFYYPYRWWSFSGNYSPPKTSDYSYKAFHPYQADRYPYTSKQHPYKFKPAPKRFYYDFLYL